MNMPFNLFRTLNDTEVFTAHQAIFLQGEHGDVMYVVQEGVVEIYYNEKLLDTVREGGIIGEMSLINDGVRSATAVAHTMVKLIAIDQERFEYLVQQTPNFAINVMRILSERLMKAQAMTA